MEALSFNVDIKKEIIECENDNTMYSETLQKISELLDHDYTKFTGRNIGMIVCELCNKKNYVCVTNFKNHLINDHSYVMNAIAAFVITQKLGFAYNDIINMIFNHMGFMKTIPKEIFSIYQQYIPNWEPAVEFVDESKCELIEEVIHVSEKTTNNEINNNSLILCELCPENKLRLNSSDLKKHIIQSHSHLLSLIKHISSEKNLGLKQEGTIATIILDHMRGKKHLSIYYIKIYEQFLPKYPSTIKENSKNSNININVNNKKISEIAINSKICKNAMNSKICSKANNSKICSKANNSKICNNAKNNKICKAKINEQSKIKSLIIDKCELCLQNIRQDSVSSFKKHILNTHYRLVLEIEHLSQQKKLGLKKCAIAMKILLHMQGLYPLCREIRTIYDKFIQNYKYNKRCNIEEDLVRKIRKCAKRKYEAISCKLCPENKQVLEKNLKRHILDRHFSFLSEFKSKFGNNPEKNAVKVSDHMRGKKHLAKKYVAIYEEILQKYKKHRNSQNSSVVNTQINQQYTNNETMVNFLEVEQKNISADTQTYSNEKQNNICKFKDFCNTKCHNNKDHTENNESSFFVQDISDNVTKVEEKCHFNQRRHTGKYVCELCPKNSPKIKRNAVSKHIIYVHKNLVHEIHCFSVKKKWGLEQTKIVTMISKHIRQVLPLNKQILQMYQKFLPKSTESGFVLEKTEANNLSQINKLSKAKDSCFQNNESCESLSQLEDKKSYSNTQFNYDVTNNIENFDDKIDQDQYMTRHVSRSTSQDTRNFKYDIEENKSSSASESRNNDSIIGNRIDSNQHINDFQSASFDDIDKSILNISKEIEKIIKVLKKTTVPLGDKNIKSNFSAVFGPILNNTSQLRHCMIQLNNLLDIVIENDIPKNCESCVTIDNVLNDFFQKKEDLLSVVENNLKKGCNCISVYKCCCNNKLINIRLYYIIMKSLFSNTNNPEELIGILKSNMLIEEGCVLLVKFLQFYIENFGNKCDIEQSNITRKRKFEDDDENRIKGLPTLGKKLVSQKSLRYQSKTSKENKDGIIHQPSLNDKLMTKIKIGHQSKTVEGIPQEANKTNYFDNREMNYMQKDQIHNYERANSQILEEKQSLQSSEKLSVENKCSSLIDIYHLSQKDIINEAVICESSEYMKKVENMARYMQISNKRESLQDYEILNGDVNSNEEDVNKQVVNSNEEDLNSYEDVNSKEYNGMNQENYISEKINESNAIKISTEIDSSLPVPSINRNINEDESKNRQSNLKTFKIKENLAESVGDILPFNNIKKEVFSSSHSSQSDNIIENDDISSFNINTVDNIKSPSTIDNWKLLNIEDFIDHEIDDTQLIGIDMTSTVDNSTTENINKKIMENDFDKDESNAISSNKTSVERNVLVNAEDNISQGNERILEDKNQLNPLYIKIEEEPLEECSVIPKSKCKILLCNLKKETVSPISSDEVPAEGHLFNDYIENYNSNNYIL